MVAAISQTISPALATIAAAQLALFCASAWPSHWTALSDVMGYCKAQPNLIYAKLDQCGLHCFTLFADPNRGTSNTHQLTTGLIII
jgi:hypothetical protein